MLKAQVQAISLVLITGIVLALAGAAYFWGKPLMEKRATITDIATAEAFVINLDKEILDVTRNRGGKSIDIPQISGSSLSVNESENAVLYRFLVNQPMLAISGQTSPIPIESRHIEPVGVYGESPRVITLESVVQVDQYLMTLKVMYRELDADTVPKKGYKIVLKEQGKTGGQKVSISYDGTETGVGEAANQGDLVKTFVGIRAS